MWIVLQLTKPRSSLRGYCRRFLLEPSPNLFVGAATRPLLEDLISRIEKAAIDAVLVAQDRRSDIGAKIKLFGVPHRTTVDVDGVQLVARTIPVGSARIVDTE